jgi:hypothetical protein
MKDNSLSDESLDFTKSTKITIICDHQEFSYRKRLFIGGKLFLVMSQGG